MIETKKILQNEGDCCVAIVNGDYKVLVRIDDKNMQIIFAQKVTAVLEYIDNILQLGNGIEMLSIPKEIYKHFTVSCKEDYQMNEEEIADFNFFLEDGYKKLHEISKIKISQDQIIVNIVTLSCFLSFRKEILELKTFPDIKFALPQNKKQELDLLDSVKTIKQLLNNSIGQA